MNRFTQWWKRETEGMRMKPAGIRNDAGKLKWHLVPIPAMVAFTKVWHGGAVKYEEEQWRGGMKYSRIYRSMESHLNKWLCTDSSFDKELGTHHLMMVAWGCFVLYMYEVVFGRSDLDDRPDKGVMKDSDFDYVDLIAEKKEKDALELEALQRNMEWKADPVIRGLKHKELKAASEKLKDPDWKFSLQPLDRDDAGRLT